MSGMVERRNDPAYWVGPVRWTRLKRKILPRCDDCWLNVHAARETDVRIPRAHWKRANGPQVPEAPQVFTALCDSHRQEWQDWTPGQLVMPT